MCGSLLGSGEAKGKISCQARAPVAKTQVKEAQALGLRELQLTSSWHKTSHEIPGGEIRIAEAVLWGEPPACSKDHCSSPSSREDPGAT